MKEVHFKQYPQFNPNLNPFEMVVLGIKGGMVFDTFLRDETPKKFGKLASKIRMDSSRYLSSTQDITVNQYSNNFDEIRLVFRNYGYVIDDFYTWYCMIYYDKNYNSITDTLRINSWLHIRKELLEEYLKTEDKDEWKPILKQCLLEIGIHYEHKL